MHTHTSFCDGEGEIEDFCLAAFGKGFLSFGFSAHAPIERKTGIKSDWNLKDGRVDEYIQAVHDAKRRWEGKLAIFLGLEVDFIPDLIAPSDADFQNMGLDYMIGSVHYLVPKNGAPFTVDGPPEELEKGLKEGFGGDKEALVSAYWDSVEAMIRGGGFDILGHADLIKKNNAKSLLFNESDESYLRRCVEIARLAAKQKITAEINTGGMNRKKITEPYPSLPLLKAFREKGVPMVINADAHKPEDIDGHYKEALTALEKAGYKEAVLFEGRKYGRAVWRTVKMTP